MTNLWPVMCEDMPTVKPGQSFLSSLILLWRGFLFANHQAYAYSRGIQNSLSQCHDEFIYGHVQYIEIKKLAGNQ